jgi:hypothetical protein
MRLLLLRCVALAAVVFCPLQPVLGVDFMQANKPGAAFRPRLPPTKAGTCAQRNQDRIKAIMEGRTLVHDRNHVPARNGPCD